MRLPFPFFTHVRNYNMIFHTYAHTNAHTNTHTHTHERTQPGVIIDSLASQRLTPPAPSKNRIIIAHAYNVVGN